MNIADLSLNFLINLTAGVVGILIVLWIERQRRPRLSMSVGIPNEIVEKSDEPRKPGKWLYVTIHNAGVPRWLAWVYSGEPAMACRAWITFYHLEGHRVFDREMNARWAATPEPQIQVLTLGRTAVPPQLVTVKDAKMEQRQFVRLLDVRETYDIPAGESTNIDVVMRFRDEETAYGWCNESYLYGWKHPDWVLPKDRYLAKVRVVTGGREFTDVFLVVNDVPYADFRLEPAKPELKSRVD